MFRFKQFNIEDSHCAMKVGTDAVLLGAWVNVKGANRILDIGTGSGIIALMLAQRSSNTIIKAIESEEADAQQANENVLASPWANRVKVFHQPLQTFTSSEPFDLIVSNPPYFINSQLPPTANRAKARHTNLLSYEELIKHTTRLLTSDGRLAVILPYTEGKLFTSLAALSGFFCNRQLAFYARKSKPQERWVFEFSKQPGSLQNEKLILHSEGEAWSADYQKLTREFYLKL